MTRRSFLKTLVAIGVVAATGLTEEVFAQDLLTIENYPNNVTYEKEWIVQKSCYLHTVESEYKNGDSYIVAEYSDEFSLNENIINDMLKMLEKGESNV